MVQEGRREASKRQAPHPDRLIGARARKKSPHFRLDSVARISQNGIHYYQNPRVPPANSGRPATEREKWKGEERWNVLGLLIVVFAAWMGWLH